ncbi:hypothetical protein S40293_10951 [Stachybotrys chartarum IBT 40293]|nr:hypothetical protein S40293_10951 [Stachybotrys chartarum IBT 40293]
MKKVVVEVALRFQKYPRKEPADRKASLPAKSGSLTGFSEACPFQSGKSAPQEPDLPGSAPKQGFTARGRPSLESGRDSPSRWLPVSVGRSGTHPRRGTQGVRRDMLLRRRDDEPPTKRHRSPPSRGVDAKRRSLPGKSHGWDICQGDGRRIPQGVVET